MASFASQLTRKTFEVDVSAIRGISAIRRGLVVIAILVLGISTIGIDLAVNAATAAFLIGLLDKGRSPRATWEVMGVATLFMCGVTAVAAVLSHNIFAIMVLLALLAFGAGISSAVDQRAPQVFIFGALLTASHLINPVDISKVWISVLLVAIAGGLQTACSLAAAPIIGDSPERRQLSETMLAIAHNCAQIADDELGPARSGANEATKATSQAESLIKRGDIASEDRVRYSALLADLETLRLEARSFTSRIYFGVPIVTSTNTVATFSFAARVLTAAARAIQHRPGDQALRELNELLATNPIGDNDAPTARAVKEALQNIPGHVWDILNRRRVHRQTQAQQASLRARIAGAFQPDSTALKYAYRMAAAVVIGQVLALALNIPHGSWVAVTAMMLLRPDGTPTAPRILLRAIGTVVAVSAILVILAVADRSLATSLIVLTVVVCLNYAFAAINYGAQTALMAMTILLILSLTYPEPEQLAFDRLIDVVIGCVLGTAFAFAMPIWKGDQLRSEVAKYASATSEWFHQLTGALELAPPDRGQQLVRVRDAGIAARSLRAQAVATLHTTLLEPAHERNNAGTIAVVVTWIRRSTEAGVAVEAAARHLTPTPPDATELALMTSEDLRLVGLVLTGESSALDPAATQPSELATGAVDRVSSAKMTTLLARAEISARGALRAALRIPR